MGCGARVCYTGVEESRIEFGESFLLCDLVMD